MCAAEHVSLYACTRGSGPASFFFFNDTATTEIYTLSLHDALPISLRWSPARSGRRNRRNRRSRRSRKRRTRRERSRRREGRSEEHTSELQSLAYLVCRLLLEKKKDHVKHLIDDGHDARDQKRRQVH